MLGDCWGTIDRVGYPEHLRRQQVEAPRAAKRAQAFQLLNLSEAMLFPPGSHSKLTSQEPGMHTTGF